LVGWSSEGGEREVVADAFATDGVAEEVARVPPHTEKPCTMSYEEKPMPRKLEDVAEEALELKLDDRAALAEKLLRSLEGISEAENERLWLAEAERRLLEIRSGQIETLPGEEVLRRAAAEIS
jgi:putative addiction module component